jgi:hypothetical protein
MNEGSAGMNGWWQVTDEERRNLASADDLRRRQGEARLSALRAGLGIPVGPVMEALLQTEVESLDFFLCSGESSIALPIPSSLTLFAESGAGDVFALLDTGDPAASTDVRPVCYMAKGEQPHVVAPDLARFLGVLAVAGAWVMGRYVADQVFWDEREVILADPDRAEGFREASHELLALPGVVLPLRPSHVLQAHPDVDFPEARRPSLPLVLTLPSVHLLWAQGERAEAEHMLRALVEKWLALGDLVATSNWSELRATVAEVRPRLPDELRAGLQARGALP